MKNLLKISFILLTLYSCSSVPTAINNSERYPSSAQDNCLEIVENLINSSHGKKLTDEEVAQKKAIDLDRNEFYKNELSPYYQNQWKNYSIRFKDAFWGLKEKGSVEIKIFEKLGFKIHENSMDTPTLETFITNYKNYLSELKVPEDKRIMPALVYKKSKVEDEKKIIRTPLIDEWPGSRKEYKTLHNIRLKARETLEALASGRFPIFIDGFHDLSHFMIFARYPDYAGLLIKSSKEVLSAPLNKAELNRTAYTLEILTLADTKKSQEIKSLLSIRKLKDNSKFTNFISAINQLQQQELSDKISFWLKNYHSYLTHYAAGMWEPYEKDVYTDNLKSLAASDFLKRFYGADLTLETNINHNKVMPYNMLFEGMTHMDIFLEKLVSIKNERSAIDFFKNKNLDFDIEMDRLIRLQMARIEYALWKSSTQITVQQWFKDLYKPEIDLSSPSMQFIRDITGDNSLTYTFFKGFPN